MKTHRNIFLRYIAQTSTTPLLLEIERAKGIYLYGTDGKKYTDLISGITVSNIGHGHPAIIKAVKEQLKKYMHIMVYGEYILSPQVLLANKLAELLPVSLNCTYFVNSGSEAVEGALKLAKKFLGRTELVACNNAYHGSTHGALSIMGNEFLKNTFRPLLPDVRFIGFGNVNDLRFVTNRTACVIIEPVQGEAGVRIAENDYFAALRKKCSETGTLLIFDESQTGMGRTGRMFAFEHCGVVPDILILSKALGGGMPLGAFISSKQIMDVLSVQPPLGHITTFGGHPVSCAAALASLNIIIEKQLAKKADAKGKLFAKKLIHPAIKEIRRKGLMMAVEFAEEAFNKKVIAECIVNGVIADWFLFNNKSMRIAPPLTISKAEIIRTSETIVRCIGIVAGNCSALFTANPESAN